LTAPARRQYTRVVVTKETPPVGERVAFHVDEDAAVRLSLDDGTTLLVKPIVIDVLRASLEGKHTYYVQTAVNVIVKAAAKEGA
jgi:hypothetical protein